MIAFFSSKLEKAGPGPYSSTFVLEAISQGAMSWPKNRLRVRRGRTEKKGRRLEGEGVEEGGRRLEGEGLEEWREEIGRGGVGGMEGGDWKGRGWRKGEERFQDTSGYHVLHI